MTAPALTPLLVARPPETDDELWELVYTIWGVAIPRQRVCIHAGHVAPFEAFADAYFARHVAAIWHASRGLGGKSMMLATLGLTELVSLNADVTILGGSGEQSARVHEYMIDFWSRPRAPRALLDSDPAKTHTKLSTGATCSALTASQRSVRGPHPQRQRCDEVDEMELKILKAALGQPMNRGDIKSHTVLSSTHQNPEGTFTEAMRMANERGWPIFQWCYHENMAEYRTPAGKLMRGWLSKEELERTKGRVAQSTWTNEYELQEPNPEGRAIDLDAVNAMWDPSLGEYEGELNKYIELEPPQPGCVYATGVDWAKDVDYTIIPTRRIGDWKLVAWERTARKPWPAMVAKLNERLKRYPGVCCHDETGIGKVVDDYIEVPSGCYAEGRWLAGKLRADIFSEYIAAVEHGVFSGPRIAWAYREHKNVVNKDLFGSGHPPDSVVADALCYQARHLAASKGGALEPVKSKARKVPREAFVDPRGE